MIAKFVKIKFACLFCMVFLPGLLAACEQPKLAEGVLATVNGEPIYLREAQSLIDSRAPAAGVQPRPSLDDMRRSYTRALSTLIATTLARQELKSRDMEVTPEEVDAAIQEVRDDYGDDGLEEFMGTASIRAEDWRAQMRDFLTLEKFKDEVLLPGIKVTLDEIRDYYRQHEKNFLIPDNLYLCFLSAESPQAINHWCQEREPRKNSPALEVECLYAWEEEIPVQWQKEIRRAKPGACLPPREEEGAWHTVALLEKNRGRLVNIAEAYAFIENLLLDQKRKDAFDNWLAQKLSASHIEVAPEMNRAFEALNAEADEGAENTAQNVNTPERE